MKIGELAQRSGLRTSRIRFYEAKGLLNAVARGANGYREYPADALTVLGIIVGAQCTGFSLDEIRQILPTQPGNWRHGDLTEALRRKLADIERMEKRLRDSKKQLHALIRDIESKPVGMSCEDNTKRLLSEFAPQGSRSTSRPPGRRSGRSGETTVRRP